MPLIDDIGVVPYSAKKTSARVNSQPRFSAAIIEALKDQLVACGWDLTGAIPGTTTIFYPTGFPFSSGGSGACGCGATYVIITTLISRYVFCAYSPGQTPLPNGCLMFELGADPASSLANLATAITMFTPYTAVLGTVDGITAITLTSKVIGPFSNFDTVFADGRFGVTDGHVFGGGYKLTSVGSSPYSVTLTGAFGIGGPQDVSLTFEMGPGGSVGTASYLLEPFADAYTIVANPYSFAVFDGINVFNSIAAFAPCIPTSEDFTGAYCAFIVGPGNLTNQLMWGGGPEGQPNTQSLDAAPITMADNRRGPGVLCLRATPGVPAFTLNGQPVLIAAYVMLAATYTGEPSIVGKLWDCMVLSKQMAVGGTMQTGGRSFVCIASQDGSGGRSPSSLLFCFDDNGQPDAGAGDSGGSTDTGGGGGGGGTSPTNPTAPPGSGNGSFSGSCTCTGSPNNHTVTWASGDKFDPSMVGQTLTVPLPGLAHPWVSAGGGGDATGTLPIIASVVSPTVLTTTDDLNSSFASAAFTSP